MALKIIIKSENYHYLFAPEALAQFAPNEELFN